MLLPFLITFALATLPTLSVDILLLFVVFLDPANVIVQTTPRATSVIACRPAITVVITSIAVVIDVIKPLTVPGTGRFLNDVFTRNVISTIVVVAIVNDIVIKVVCVVSLVIYVTNVISDVPINVSRFAGNVINISRISIFVINIS